MVSSRARWSRRGLAVVVSAGFTAAAALGASSAPVSAGTLPRSEPEVQVDLAAFDPAKSDVVTDAQGRVQVLVELNEPAAALVYAAALADKSVSPRQAEINAVARGRSQIATNRAALAELSGALSALGTTEVYRVERAMNGISVMVAPAKIPALARIADVKRVLPVPREFPTGAQSVAFIGTPNVWGNSIGLPAGADGTGIKLGVIDTGTDYMHPDFGGPGAAAADYNNERTATTGFTVAGSIFPTAKVVGGTDFAGDAYNGSNAPVPDPNPMDCNGHGSHVSGTAAGFGMTTGGATFPGPYDSSPATYAPLLIAPGTAPKASIYALRVFGCFGSTGLTVNAINWAMDPNGDNDMSDHLDVINMSLGSNFGSGVNSTAVASDNAAAAGVIVVASAGNAGDTFFISGAPGSGQRVLATAASVDSGETAPLVQVNAPASIAGNYLAGSAAFGAALVPSGSPPGPHSVVIGLDPSDAAGASTTDGCSALTNAAAVAGNIALIDRGTCGFIVKVKNAQNAGAVGVIIADNAPGTPPPGLGGTDPTINIPSVRVTLADGNTLKANIATLNVTLIGQNGADTLASFSSRGPRRIDGTGVLRLKPDIAAPGLNILSVETGNVCTTATSGGSSCTGASDPSGTQVATRTLTISGTSMASPHMAGVMALLRQLHPTWTVEELKALAMNYATHDVTLFGNATPPKFNVSRIGGGRVDPSQSATASVVAFNAEDNGAVSVSFQPEVVGVTTQRKKLHVVNKGTTSQTFDLAFATVVDSPGVSFSLPGGNTVTVAGGATVDIDVQMNADAAQMDHTRDAALFATQGVQANFGDQPRNFLAEEGAYLTFSQASTLKLRVPVYMAERPSSTMSAASAIVTGGAPTGSTTIPLSGSGVCTGTLAAGPTCAATFPTDVESVVTPLELQVVSPRDPVNAPDYADIQYVGAAYIPGVGSPNINNDLVMFGVSTYGDWSTPNEVSFNICVDNNNDGVYEKVIYNANPAIFVSGASNNDNFVRIIRDTSTNGNTILGTGSFANLVSPATFDSAMHLNNVMLLAATPSQLGITSTAVTSVKYKVYACGGNNGCARTATGDRCSPAAGTFADVAAGPFTYNWAAQGVNFGGSFMREDLNGATIPVTWNTANLTANGSLGALLLHHMNKSGTRAEVVPLDTAQQADIALTAAVSAPTPAFGSNVTLTLTATNNGPNAAPSVVVSNTLPGGLSYVSDNGGGAFASANGTWTVGALASGASASLQIVATVNSSDQQCDKAVAMSVTPVDTVQDNNTASVCVLAPRTADLAVAMTAASPTALVGANVTYNITVSNSGGDTGFGLNLNEAFPAFPALNPASFVASEGVYTPATGLWNVASLGKGSTATLALTLPAPNMAGALTDQATLAGSTSDPNTANNTASATVTVLSPSNVTSTMSVAGTRIIGSNVTYTVTLANSAAYDQQNNAGPEFALTLPASLTLVSATAPTGTAIATVATNNVTWDGVVPANGSATITIVATIKNTVVAGTSISAQGTVNYDADGNGVSEATRSSDDPAVGGATDPTVFVAISPALLTATKTAAGQFVNGTPITYTIVISNSGAGTQLDNPGNEFTDVLPATLVLPSASASSGAITVVGNTVNWNGSIPPAGTVTITISAIINGSPVNQPISNQGTLSYDADGNGSNEATGLTDDPNVGGAANPTVITGAAPIQVPVDSTWMLTLLGVLLMLAALTRRGRIA